jgi:predicted N-acetyltransferase YhbS
MPARERVAAFARIGESGGDAEVEEQRRQLPLSIDIGEARLQMLAAPEIDHHPFDFDAFLREIEADPTGTGRPGSVVELHQIAIRICFTFIFKTLKAPLHSGKDSPPGRTGPDTELITLVPIAAVAASDIEHLLDLAFGTGRHQRTAYRLREGMEALPELSLAALEDGELVGSIQCWPIQLTGKDGDGTPLILVGPVAVQPGRQRAGVGRMLMDAALAQADATGNEPMMLIGDASYYERFFDFSSRHTHGWTVPGPVERDRLLARLRPGQAVPEQGILGPRVAALVPGGD